jgi:hypothetical protein
LVHLSEVRVCLRRRLSGGVFFRLNALLEENDRVNVAALTWSKSIEQWPLHDLPQIEHLAPVTIPSFGASRQMWGALAEFGDLNSF